jgi:hypothetical protein
MKCLSRQQNTSKVELSVCARVCVHVCVRVCVFECADCCATQDLLHVQSELLYGTPHLIVCNSQVCGTQY